MTRLVLIGGGHSHVEVLRKMGMEPFQDCHATLVARDVLAPYSGMLPGYIAGHYSYRECHIDVRPLARHAGVRLCHGSVDAVDLENRLVLCPDRPAISFDLLSVNIGSRPSMANIPGAREFALPAKPVDEFIVEWEAVVRRAATHDGPFRLVVVGAGAGGVELALSAQHRLAERFREAGRAPTDLQVSIVTDGADALLTHNAGARRRMRRALESRGIALHLDDAVAEVRAEMVRCASGNEHPYDALVWTTQAAAQPWIQASGLATDDAGFLLVDETLRSVSHPFVFAAGDIASMQASPRPKSGVFAVRQGPYLSENLRRAAGGEEPELFTPQLQFLSLISTGDRNAIASRGGWSAEGAWVWRLKDRIDQKFMRKYEVDSGMEARTASNMPDAGREMEMHCAGCGSKVGHTVLRSALARLESMEHPGVLVGLDAPDDAAVVEPPPGKLAVHTVDFFPALVDDAFLFGQIAANHCLSDIYAMGATPHTALAIVTLPHAPEWMQEDLLTDVLAGALHTLMPAHTALAGGHTTEGEVLSFGLSVNGFVDREALLHKGGMQPGDRLILTKPLGTGAIFAADMRGRAKGHWLDEALAAMLLSNQDAARCVFEHSATACTDVTGFGLVGHLLEMQRATGVDVELVLENVPVFAGALEATEAGFRSSLYPHNALAEGSVRERAASDHAGIYPLLYDPQTAGGLLAAVPEAQAQACLEALHAAGYARAALVGRVLELEAENPGLVIV